MSLDLNRYLHGRAYIFLIFFQKHISKEKLFVPWLPYIDFSKLYLEDSYIIIFININFKTSESLQVSVWFFLFLFFFNFHLTKKKKIVILRTRNETKKTDGELKKGEKRKVVKWVFHLINNMNDSRRSLLSKKILELLKNFQVGMIWSGVIFREYHQLGRLNIYEHMFSLILVYNVLAVDL